MLRMHGDLMPIKFRDLGDAELEGYITEVLTQSQLKTLRDGHDLDFSYVSADGGRFRVNVYRKETGIGAAFRSIPTQMPTMEQLALPPIVRKLCDYHQGMILVTGSTGTGKTTTLAAMIDYLNTTRTLNIISLEDPIEFVHRSKSSQVIQRELGTHLPTFAEGVRAAMREDPDVILVGELRDAETIAMAMTAAETGHLVLGTLHTTSATKTIDRIIDALPVEEREQTKSFLASSLIAVITQILLKTPDQRARRAVCEIMVLTKAIGKLIMTDQSHQIPSQLQMGKEYGMQLLDQALLAAIAAKEVDPDQAYSYAVDKRQFQRFVTDLAGAAAARTAPRPDDRAMPAIDTYLNQVLERDGSDLHFLAGDLPRVRQYGELKPLRPGAARPPTWSRRRCTRSCPSSRSSASRRRTARTSPTAFPGSRDFASTSCAS